MDNIQTFRYKCGVHRRSQIFNALLVCASPAHFLNQQPHGGRTLTCCSETMRWSSADQEDTLERRAFGLWKDLQSTTFFFFFFEVLM